MGIILLPYTRGSIANMEKTWLEADEQRLFAVLVSSSPDQGNIRVQPNNRGSPIYWGVEITARSRRVSGRAEMSPSPMIPGHDVPLRLFAGWLENGVWKKGRWSVHLEGEAAGESAAAAARLAGEGVAAC